MDKLFIFLLCFYFGSAKIKILDLKVPQSIESGSVDDVILDCDFDAGGDEGIEVKWFVDGINEQIYQWIPETKRPGQAIGKFKDYIDVNYKISNDQNTMYRALHLVDITPELSGNYSCKVSGYESEDVRTKSMVIYDPAESGLDLDIIEQASMVVCTASGLYPKPNMTVYIRNDNESHIIFRQDDETLEFDEEERVYNVSSVLNFERDNLTDTSFHYICELNIPGTSYQLFEEETYTLASKSPVHLLSVYLLSTTLMVLLSSLLKS